MGRAVRTLALILAVVLIALSSDQVITRDYIFSNIGTLFAWSGSAQSWSGSTVNLTCTDWTSYIRNDGTACSPGAQTVLSSYASAHAIVSVTHTPLLANNTFAMGSFASWTSANTGGCTGTPFTGAATTDQDGDSGLAVAGSQACIGTPATLTLNQTFSTGGVPTSQTYAFWYKGLAATSGSPACAVASGTVSMVLKLNGTTIATIASPILDGAWHQAAGTMTAMTNGSNTLVLSATLTAALGQAQKLVFGALTCVGPLVYAAQSVQVDDFVLSAVW